ncbi:putative secreted protein [Cryptosporidium hominis]
MMSSIILNILKTLIIFVLINIIGSDSGAVSNPTKQQNKFTKLNQVFKRKNKQYYAISKDGSLIFPALKAISCKNIPLLKNVNSFNNEYDEDILNRSHVYIIKNGEVPGWDGMKIPIHYSSEYSKLRLKPPEKSKSISIFPPVVAERFMLFALEECLLPSKFFIQVAFCTFDAIYPFLEGVPSGEVMQDIVGAAMYSVNKIGDDFSFDTKYCRKAIAMIPDSRINLEVDSKCNDISLCMHQDHFPQLSRSLSVFTLDQLIEKSFILHGLEYQLRVRKLIQSILWKIIKFAHKSNIKRENMNPNRLFSIIRAYVLTLYIRHSSQIIPGWYLNKFPSAKNSLSFVYVKNEDYTEQSAYINYCARKLKWWLDAFQPIVSPIFPNMDTKDEVSRSACFQAGRAGFVSNEEFDFSNMIEEGTESVDLLNLQLPIILKKSEEEIKYIRNNNLRKAQENRKWTSCHESYPYSLNGRMFRETIHEKDKLNLQNLAQKGEVSQDKDTLLDEVKDLLRRKKNGDELSIKYENIFDTNNKESNKKTSFSPVEFIAQLKQDNIDLESRDANTSNISYKPSRSIIGDQLIQPQSTHFLKQGVYGNAMDDTNSGFEEDEIEEFEDEDEFESENDNDYSTK